MTDDDMDFLGDLFEGLAELPPPAAVTLLGLVLSALLVAWYICG
jgi:hypothetical protein